MAKRKVKAPVEPTLEPTVELINEVVVENVTPEEILNEVVVEDTTELLEDVSSAPLAIEKVEEKIEEVSVVVEESPVDATPLEVEVSAKDLFLNAIAVTPYTIYQNGILVCVSNPYLEIKAEEKYFEINFKKHSYAGIEIKYS